MASKPSTPEQGTVSKLIFHIQGKSSVTEGPVNCWILTVQLLFTFDTTRSHLVTYCVSCNRLVTRNTHTQTHTHTLTHTHWHGLRSRLPSSKAFDVTPKWQQLVVRAVKAQDRRTDNYHNTSPGAVNSPQQCGSWTTVRVRDANFDLAKR